MTSPWLTIIASLHHLLLATLALCCGITLQSWYMLMPCAPAFVVLGITIVTIMLSLLQQGRKKLYLLLPCAFICGCLRYQAQRDEHQAFYATHQGLRDAITGVITEKESLQHPFLKQRITLALNEKPSFSVHIFSPRRIHATVGDTVQFNDVTFKKSSNQGYDDYLTKEGVIASLFLKGRASYQVIRRDVGSWARALHKQRNRILWSLRKKIPEGTFALFAAIFFGYKHATKISLADYKNLFKNWGILHYLARSGLHVVIVILLLQFLARFIPCSLTIKQIVMSFFIIIYWFLSWPSTSFMRALISFFLLSWCIIARWQSSFLHLLTLTCFFTLISNPLLLFFLDFQLSYGMTYALAFMTFSRTTESPNKH